MSGSGTDHGANPRYGSNPVSNSSDNRTTPSAISSRSASGADPASGSSGKAGDNCHFAFSPELQLVDNLVSILAQNGGRAPSGGQGQR